MIVDGQPRGTLNVTTWHEHGLTLDTKIVADADYAISKALGA